MTTLTAHQLDLTSTTIRNYSLVAEARANRDAAMEVWRTASNAYLANRTTPNAAAMMRASEAHKKAEAQYQSVHIPTKHNRGTVRAEGSDDTMRGARMDAGFSESGVM